MKLTVNGYSSDTDISWAARNYNHMPVYQRNWVRAEDRVVGKVHWELRLDLKERLGVGYFRRMRACILPGELRS